MVIILLGVGVFVKVLVLRSIKFEVIDMCLGEFLVMGSLGGESVF